MGDAVGEQEYLIGNTIVHVDNVSRKLNLLNMKLKKTLNGIRKPSRFCIDIILLIIILALGGYLYNTLRKV